MSTRNFPNDSTFPPLAIHFMRTSELTLWSRECVPYVRNIYIIYRISRSSSHRLIEQKHLHCLIAISYYIKCGLSASRACCMMHHVSFHLVICGFIAGSLYVGGYAYRIAVLRHECSSSFLCQELYLSRR